MKTMRNLFAAFVLVSALSVSAFAGNIHTGAPEPPPSEGEMTISDGGDMHTTNSDGGDIHTGDTDEATAGDAAVAGALSLLQGVLSLL
jgi:hypothetical protein